MIHYDNIHYANERLVDTIIRADGMAVSLIAMNKKTSHIRYLRTGLEDNVKTNLIDITPVTLGYVNHPMFIVTYLTRCPFRKWKQGFSLRANARSVCGLNPLELPLDMVANTIENVYPSYEEACENVRRSKGQVAINREIALYTDPENDKVIKVYNRGDYYIGTLNKKNEIEFVEGAEWIVESLTRWFDAY